MTQDAISKEGMETILNSFDKVMGYLHSKACFMAEKQGLEVYGKNSIKVGYSEHPGYLRIEVWDKRGNIHVSFNTRPSWIFMNNELFAQKIEQVARLNKLNTEYSILARALEGAGVDVETFTTMAKEAEEILRTAPEQLKQLRERIAKAQEEMLDE